MARPPGGEPTLGRPDALGMLRSGPREGWDAATSAATRAATTRVSGPPLWRSAWRLAFGHQVGIKNAVRDDSGQLIAATQALGYSAAISHQ